MKENVWGYTIEHNKPEALNRYEKSKIVSSLRVSFKHGNVKKKDLTIEWKVEGYIIPR